jgi:hypothetical protein
MSSGGACMRWSARCAMPKAGPTLPRAAGKIAYALQPAAASAIPLEERVANAVSRAKRTGGKRVAFGQPSSPSRCSC